MERDVVLDDRLVVRFVERQFSLVVPEQFGGGLELRDTYALRSPRGGLRLEDPAYRVQVGCSGAVVQVDHEAHRRQQHRRVQLGDVGAVSLARLENSHHRERADPLAQRIPRYAEGCREVLLDGKPVTRPQAAVDDHLPDSLDHDVGL